MSESEINTTAIDLSKIDPKEQHSLREWSNKLGLGEANIRTAIRKGSLKGEMVTKKNEDGTESTTRRWEMTGQQILDWRANNRRGTGTPKVKGASSYRVKLTIEQAPLAQEALNKLFPGVDVTLTLPKPKVAAPAIKAEVVTPKAVKPEAPAEKRSLFGNK